MKANIVKFNIHYLNDEMPRLEYVNGNSDWIDLRAVQVTVFHSDSTTTTYSNAGDIVKYKAGDVVKVNFGVSIHMQDTETGVKYKANCYPRSSLFTKTGLFLTNHVGCIDYSYRGTNDWWMGQFLAMKEGEFAIYDRLIQFDIKPIEPRLVFNEVAEHDAKDRGGYGTSNMK